MKPALRSQSQLRVLNGLLSMNFLLPLQQLLLEVGQPMHRVVVLPLVALVDDAVEHLNQRLVYSCVHMTPLIDVHGD